MKDWLNDESLAEAMALVPLCDAFVKAVKSAVRAKLEEDPESVPGFKLRSGGNITSYDAQKVAKIIMDANVLGWDDLLKHMKFALTGFIPEWADHTGMTKSEAKKDLQVRLKDVAMTKPKASTVVKAK